MPWPGGFSELSVRAEELTAAPPGIARVYVVENEITYLAFPPVEAAMVIFGRGYAVPTLDPWPGSPIRTLSTGVTSTLTGSPSWTGCGAGSRTPGPY